MKKIVLNLSIFFAFTAFVAAQEEHDKTLRQPPTITQAQVEKDTLMAEQERKKHEEAKKAVKEEKKKKEEDNRKRSNAINTSSTKKTSTRPGKQ